MESVTVDGEFYFGTCHIAGQCRVSFRCKASFEIVGSLFHGEKIFFNMANGEDGGKRWNVNEKPIVFE